MIYVRSEPRSEPIRLAEARSWLGMTDANDVGPDADIWGILRALRRYAEKFTGRCFVDRDLELNLDRWPGNCIELPVAPIVDVDYIKYLDTTGALCTLYDVTQSPQVGEDQVQIDLKSQPARIQPAWGKYWPTLRGYDFNAVQIGFTAGYGTGGSPEDLTPIPEELRLWLRIRLATLYEHREAIVVGGILAEVPRSHNDALLDPLMLGRRIG
jgi:uncharacterized phiE125 gp8 family phage protein